MKVKVQFAINPNIYLRDPQETKLGQKIFQQSISLINDIGFENFNFKKLAAEINCTEASVYRYFENKHKLLNFLTAWYWELINFNIDFAIAHSDDGQENLKKIIKILTHYQTELVETDVDEKQLHRIIINEASKSFHTIEIDSQNLQGNFLNYKNLISRITEIISSIDSTYSYPNSLATLLMDTAIDHVYYAEHLPKLVNLGKENISEKLYYYLLHLAEKLLNLKF